MVEYILKIEASKDAFPEITAILEVEPSKTQNVWELSIDEDNALFTRAIAYLVSIIESKKAELEGIGVTHDSISVWLYKPYTGQCNMEFNPNEMKLLADNGITLCISCWEE